jgi:hypothetical protein
VEPAVGGVDHALQLGQLVVGAVEGPVSGAAESGSLDDASFVRVDHLARADLNATTLLEGDGPNDAMGLAEHGSQASPMRLPPKM